MTTPTHYRITDESQYSEIVEADADDIGTFATFDEAKAELLSRLRRAHTEYAIAIRIAENLEI
jgi:hypothetical protein